VKRARHVRLSLYGFNPIETALAKSMKCRIDRTFEHLRLGMSNPDYGLSVFNEFPIRISISGFEIQKNLIFIRFLKEK
jgi:hypothetical protein